MSLNLRFATRSLRAACAVLTATAAFAAEPMDLKDPTARLSYAIGTSIGKSFKRQDLTLDTAVVVKAIDDVLKSRALALTDEEIQKTMMELQETMGRKEAEKAGKAGAENLKEGQAYLAANAKKDGVKTTASGLQYKVLKAGTGKSSTKTDTVKVHYTGTFIDGAKFDSSVDRGEPIEFPVGGVIPGWTEALLLMKVGDKWQLTIPAAIAYGEQGPGEIGPNRTLLFDVELLGVK